MPASIFNGTAVKILKKILKFKDSNVTIITGDTDDPTSVAKDAIQGSMYVRSGTSDIYVKQDNGSSTNWNLMGDATDFANRTLSNLLTTAINENLTPDTNDSRYIGIDGTRWSRVYASSLRASDTSASLQLTTGRVLDNTGTDSIHINNRELQDTDGNTNISYGSNAGIINFHNNRIVNLQDPSGSQDATTKTYVDNLFEGIKPKEAARVATTANITLSGNQTIDGVLTVDGDRVLVKDQTLPEENGIYISDSGAWSRSSDFDSLSPINEIKGAIVGVALGTANAGKIFVCNSDPTTLGTDPITFVFFNSVATLNAGNGIDITGTTISVSTDGQGFDFSSGDLILELDSTTLSKSASGLKVATGGITNTEINAAANIDATKLGTGVVDNTEFNYLNGVTSSIQTQLDTKFAYTLVSINSNTSAVNKTTYLTDSSGGAFAVTLPAPSANAYVVVKDSNGSANLNNVTINPNGAELIDGASSYILSSNYGSKTFVSNGTNWYIL